MSYARAMLDQLVSQVKDQVLSSLEENVYQQAVSQNLVDGALKALIEAAIDRLQLEMPAAAGGLGAVFGLLSPFMSQLSSLGITDQLKGLIAQYEVDKAMRDTVIKGLTRYLEENGTHLMEVAVAAVVDRLGKTTQGG